MAKMKFDFTAYRKAEHIYSNVMDGDVFEVVIGTKRMVLDDIMDKAAQDILKSARFRLVKNDNLKKCSCEVVMYKGKKTFCLNDEHYMMLDILKKHMTEFFKNEEFTPQSFAEFARTILRPVSVMVA